ncbi:hypothetical protein [Pantoea piersonii]|uniref:hypothetical protein n=1 Tax=Pantoea piersonii TaxID=2364647 RepID=UPI00289D96EB|nr:hypothetical protein [Pantoea piersonii]
MNENTDKIVASLIQKAMSGVDQAVDFSKAQLPEVIEQLMYWKFASYSLRIFTGILIMTAMTFAFKKACRWHESTGKETAGFVGIVSSGAILLASCVVLFANIGNLIQLWLAPKVWLIEYAAQLISQN